MAFFSRLGLNFAMKIDDSGRCRAWRELEFQLILGLNLLKVGLFPVKRRLKPS